MRLVTGGLPGVLVDISLGLVGGGSGLAAPLLVYFVGVPEPHRNRRQSCRGRRQRPEEPCAPFAGGRDQMALRLGLRAIRPRRRPLAGSTVGKLMIGETLLALSGVLMLVVSILMFKNRGGEGYPPVRLNRENFPRPAAAGAATDALRAFSGSAGDFSSSPD